MSIYFLCNVFPVFWLPPSWTDLLSAEVIYFISEAWNYSSELHFQPSILGVMSILEGECKLQSEGVEVRMVLTHST